jgi:hypothetical protein
LVREERERERERESRPAAAPAPFSFDLLSSPSSLFLSLPSRPPDITIAGAPAGRVQMELFADIAPKTAENFRQLCTGEFR